MLAPPAANSSDCALPTNSPSPRDGPIGTRPCERHFGAVPRSADVRHPAGAAIDLATLTTQVTSRSIAGGGIERSTRLQNNEPVHPARQLHYETHPGLYIDTHQEDQRHGTEEQQVANEAEELKWRASCR